MIANERTIEDLSIDENVKKIFKEYQTIQTGGAPGKWIRLRQGVKIWTVLVKLFL